MTMLDVRGLSTRYGAVVAVDGVDLTAQAGRITCVMGRNGTGKTTLMRTIMGQIKAHAGTVAVDGHDLSTAPAHARAQAGVALVPQGREIFPKLTVAENLAVALSARGDGLKKVPDDLIDLFPILRQFLKRMGGDLSGGQQQQLAIARALVTDPKVLLLDEPTEGIQPNIIEDIGRILRRLAEERKLAIVLVEQYFDFVQRIGDEFLILDRGRVVAQGACKDLSMDSVGKHLSV
jgi:urea transport system ATP-binding protein